MAIIYTAFLFFHITVGFLSLIFFWIPVAVKKGSALHNRAGHWYANTMYAVGASALILSLMLMTDPIAFKYPDTELSTQQAIKVIANQKDIGLFLLAISCLTIVGIRHGLQSIQAKGNHARMRSIDNLMINAILLAVGVCLGITATGNSPMNVLFYIFAALCTFTALSNFRYCFKASVSRGEQIISHLSAIIGAGIGSHTAFFVFGANRFLEGLLTGYAGLIPWVLPGIVGTILIVFQAQKYKPKKLIKHAK